MALQENPSGCMLQVGETARAQLVARLLRSRILQQEKEADAQSAEKELDQLYEQGLSATPELTRRALGLPYL